jgi:hypothetical protein
MKKLGMFALACGVTLAMAAAARAQVQPAVVAGGQPTDKKSKKDKDSFEALLKSYQQGGTNRFAVGDDSMTHGDFVTLKSKNGPVTGVFVYSDPKTGKVYIRQKAGMPPVAVPSRDIDQIRPAGTTSDKGAVKPAMESGSATQPGGYEVHGLTINNGPTATTYYFDSSLSPGERDQLSAIENAGNDVARKAALVQSLRQSLENAANDTGVTVVPSGGYGGYGGYGAPYLAYPYYYPVAYYNLYYYLYYPMWGGYGGYGGYPGNWGGGYGGGGSTVVVNNSGGGSSVAAISKSLAEASSALADAQKSYASLRGRAIHDAEGRVIAVRLDE